MPRRWNNEEVRVLVEEVEANYDFLTGAFTPSKTKAMVDGKWLGICDNINALGGGAKLEVDQVKKKWFDMKSMAKKAVAEYKKELSKTGGGTSTATMPSECQFKIASFIGAVHTEGIPGTANCDVAHALASSNTSPIAVGATASAGNASALATLMDISGIRPISPAVEPIHLVGLDSDERPAKRAKLSKREVQNEEIVKAEKEIKCAVIQIKDELHTTNEILMRFVEETKRGNDIQQHLVEIMERQQQKHTERNVFTIPELNYN